MAVKRRISKHLQHRITPEAIASFAAGDVRALHRALDLKPWDCSPLDIEDDEQRPDWIIAERWDKAKALRAQLQRSEGAGRAARASAFPRPCEATEKGN